MRQRRTQSRSLAARRRWVLVACVAEVLLIVVGVCEKLVIHRIVGLVVAAIFAVLLIIAVPVLRRLGRI